MRSIPGTITHYLQDRDQVEELDLTPEEKHVLRRSKAEARLIEAQRQVDKARAVVAEYDRAGGVA